MSPIARFILILLTSVAAMLVAQRGEAQVGNHQLLRRLVVFPVKAPTDFAGPAEEAWWGAREEFTKSRRFLVASKQFLVKSDVFQSRGELEPADAIILGKLLDAHALVTIQLVDRRVELTVYDGTSGSRLWSKAVTLHPSLTITDQLPKITKKLVNAFIAAIPYQGFTIIDSLISRPVYEEGDVKLAQVDLGIMTGAQIGDTVQWIKLSSIGVAPLFQGGGKMTVFAEGKVVKLDQGVATIEILRATSLKDIREYSLVRVPREAEALQTEFAINETPKTTLTAELVSPELSPMVQQARERKPLVATLSFVGSIVAMILLAF
jgi:hypothetical protein